MQQESVLKSIRYLGALAVCGVTVQLTGCGGGGGGGEVDVDADNDGLIEIRSLQQLDWMRNDLAGTSRHDGVSGTSKGCPATGCNGYELVTDLDFDTNGSGAADVGDAYFDYHGDGSKRGWLPVGTASAPFTGEFHGNGHTISNLFIDRSATDAATAGINIGLFGRVGGLSTVRIHDLIIAGASTEVIGSASVGLVVGSASRTWLTGLQVSGKVSGFVRVGGIVGWLDQGRIETASSDVDVTGDEAGGIGGRVTTGNDFFNVTDSHSSGTVEGSFNIGGLIGYLRDSSSFASNNTVIVEDSSSASAVTGGANGRAGGLIGHAEGSEYLGLRLQIDNVSATGTVVSTGIEAGGLIGRVAENVSIREGSADNDVTGLAFIGGLVGHALNDVFIEDCSSSGMTSGEAAVAGLVGGIETGGPKEVLISGCVSTGDVIVTGYYAGGIGGWVEGDVNIWNSASTGDVVGVNADYVGGVAGLARFGTISIIGSYSSGQVSGRDFVGGLVGSFNFVSSVASGTGGDNVETSFSTSTVTGRNYVGGLIGLSYNVRHVDTFATGTVTGNDLVGGLIGDINESFDTASLARSFSAGSVVLTSTPTGSTHRLGGLVGYNDGASFESNHFATNSSGQANALGANNSAGGLNPVGISGATLANLQAPTAPAFSGGGVDTLYDGWNPTFWHFGNTAQLPGLRIGGVVHRDGNADGTLD